MNPLLVGAGAAVLVVSSAIGIRLVTSTGLEAVEQQYRAEEEKKKRGGFAALLDAFGALFMRPAVQLYGAKRLRKLDQAIRRAGRPDGVTVTIFVRRQAGAVALGFLLLLLFSFSGQILFGLIFFAMFALWMRVWLVSAAQTRQRRLDRELPDFLDVLGVTVMAGLGFRQALERVCDFHEGALAEEMRRSLREMGLGMSRRQTFEGLRERTSSPAVGSFVTALLQAEELGVPLADAIDSIARDTRREHAERVRQKAARAAPMVSLVMIFTVLPGAILLIGASIVVANLDVLGDFL